MTYENYFSIVNKEAQAVDELVQEIPQLSKFQINWRSSENSWSIGECFEHLLRVNEYYIDHFRKAAADPLKKLSDQEKFKTTISGRFIIYGVKPQQKIKAKTTKDYNPVHSEIDPQIIQRFLDQHGIIKALAGKCRGADLNKIKIVSPFTRLIKYNVGEAFMIIMLHDQRHILQAKRVIENPGFPGK